MAEEKDETFFGRVKSFFERTGQKISDTCNAVLDTWSELTPYEKTMTIFALGSGVLAVVALKQRNKARKDVREMANIAATNAVKADTAVNVAMAHYGRAKAYEDLTKILLAHAENNAYFEGKASAAATTVTK